MHGGKLLTGAEQLLLIKCIVLLFIKLSFASSLVPIQTTARKGTRTVLAPHPRSGQHWNASTKMIRLSVGDSNFIVYKSVGFILSITLQ